jgi:hypothetical protein
MNESGGGFDNDRGTMLLEQRGQTPAFRLQKIARLQIAPGKLRGGKILSRLALGQKNLIEAGKCGFSGSIGERLKDGIGNLSSAVAKPFEAHGSFGISLAIHTGDSHSGNRGRCCARRQTKCCFKCGATGMRIAELESGEGTFQQFHEQFIELLGAGIANEGTDGVPLGTRFQIARQNRLAGGLQKLGGGLLVEDRKTWNDARLEWEALQQPFAEGMDRLDLQAARRIEGAGEKRAGTRKGDGRGTVAGKSLDTAAEGGIIERGPFAKIVKEAAGHFSGGGVGEGEAQDALGRVIFEQEADHAMDENMGLAAPGIGRHPGGNTGVRGTPLRSVG